MDKDMLNSLLRSSGKAPLTQNGSDDSVRRQYTQPTSSYNEPVPEPKEDVNDDYIDISRSDKIYDSYISNLDNILKASPVIYKRKLNALQKEIDSPELCTYETDRLLLLKGVLNWGYYAEHYLDENYDDYEEEYLSILDEVDSIVDEMSDVTEEALYLYYIANMYSIGRFKDVKPLDKLQELWDRICSINLQEGETEWKVSFWEEKAQDTYNLMKSIYSNSTSSTESYNGNSNVFKKVQSILVDKLTIDPYEVTTNAEFVTDLGCDSLDVVELIMEFEKVFGITIPDHHAERITTVGDAVTYIERAIR